MSHNDIADFAKVFVILLLSAYFIDYGNTLCEICSLLKFSFQHLLFSAL